MIFTAVNIVVIFTDRASCKFGVVTYEDSTNITLQLNTAEITFDGVIYSARSHLSVVLNKKRVLHIEEHGDISGIEVFADKRITVFAGGK